MLHSLCWCDSTILIIYKHFVQKVNSIVSDSRVIVLVYKAFQGNCIRVHYKLPYSLRHIDLISAHVFVQIGRAHSVHNLDKLVIIVRTLKERVNFKEKASEGAAYGPHV